MPPSATSLASVFALSAHDDLSVRFLINRPVNDYTDLIKLVMNSKYSIEYQTEL